jgi:hypothetical protein
MDNFEFIIPMLGCTAIIALHIVSLIKFDKWEFDSRWEHRCLICAYMLFLIHYLIEYMPLPL